MEKETATDSSIFGWKIPWTEEPESDMTEKLNNNNSNKSGNRMAGIFSLSEPKCVQSMYTKIFILYPYISVNHGDGQLES